MKNKSFRKCTGVPPDGGWGYVVCVGVSLIFGLSYEQDSNFIWQATNCFLASMERTRLGMGIEIREVGPQIAATAHKAVFGLIYVDFLAELGAGTGAVTVVFGVYEVSIAISGFLTTIILKKLSVRKVAFIGAIIYVVGSIFAIFVTSTLQLVITNGLLQGTGLGVLSSASYTSINSYFVRKRVFCLGLCKTCLAVTSVVYPLISKFLLTEYGFRGTLAIICAISANSILGSLTLQPVRWHMKYASEESKLNLENNMGTEIDIPKNGKSEETGRNPNKIILFGNEKKSHLYEEEQLLNALTKDVEREDFEDLARKSSKDKTARWSIYNLLDLTILKDVIYINIVIGMALTFFSNKTFFILEPLFLDKIKLSKTEIANIMAVGSATDMVVRLLFSLSGIFIQINSRYIFYVGALLQIIFKITIVQFTTYVPLLLLTAVLGALKSLIFITQPIVLADYMPIEKYPSAYGFYMLLDGAISMTVGPLIGYLRDYTDSYVVAYTMLAVCNLCCVVPWTIEAVYERVKRRNSIIDKDNNL